MIVTPEESMERLKQNIVDKYLSTSYELLDIKMHLRALLDYPDGEPSAKQMVYMLADKMTKQNERIAELEGKP